MLGLKQAVVGSCDGAMTCGRRPSPPITLDTETEAGALVIARAQGNQELKWGIYNEKD